MIIIPREKPAIENLNSYYLNIEKLVEHYQGDLGAGVIHFKSPVSEGVLFFDESNLVNGHLEERKQKIIGQDAIDRLIDPNGQVNFIVSVYRIIPDRIYFWANLSNSQVVYKDLASDFTDLDKLIKKMESEKLTGYIDIQITGDKESRLLFFFNGEVIGGSSTDAGGEVDRSDAYMNDLIDRSREHGGRFNVRKIFIDQARTVSTPSRDSVSDAPETGSTFSSPEFEPERIMEMLTELLVVTDGLVKGNKKIRTDFETLLNKKFVEKIDKYEFLDPFAAEFKYSGKKVDYTGSAAYPVVVEGVVECISEIATEFGFLSQLRKELDSWRMKFAEEVFEFDIRL